MTYEEFAADLPEAKTFTFSSAEENEETMQRLDVTQLVRQLGKGKFRADMAVRSTGIAELYADRFSTSFSIYLEPPAGCVGLLVFRSANGEFLSCGEQVANDKLVFMGAGTGADLIGPDLSGSDALTLPHADFVEILHALCPTVDAPEPLAVIGGDTAGLHALRAALVHLVGQPELDFTDSRVADLTANWIAWMGHHSIGWRPEGVNGSTARKRIACAARDFIEDHYRDSIRIDDVCRAAGVGVRTLQRCFREYFDVTMTEYVKAIRLDAAQRGLNAADPNLDSVAEIALRNGFTHLGRFSTDFRKQFGESPSETLAARPGQKSPVNIDSIN